MTTVLATNDGRSNLPDSFHLDRTWSVNSAAVSLPFNKTNDPFPSGTASPPCPNLDRCP